VVLPKFQTAFQVVSYFTQSCINRIDIHDTTDYCSSCWSLGLGIAGFDRDFLDRRYSSHVEEDIQSARSSGVKSTPTFFINEDRYNGPWDLDSLISALDEESVFSWRQTSK
jgi:predicted DsbA family dithiol-disulfide isomerase